MSFSKITKNVSIHQALPDNPNLTTIELKKKWDEASEIIKDSFNNLIDELNKNIYPVGSIYISVKNTNPNSYFGGTWVAWGSGRVPIGINSNDTDFNTAEKTGGSKSHNHTYINATNFVPGPGSGVGGTNNFLTTEKALPPYIVCYMWKRTA